jgi:glycosyltransferase involved in cell wall biosynthesis
MPGYRFDRTYLATSAQPSPSELGRGLLEAARRARRHELLHVHGEAAGGLTLPLIATQPSVVTLHGLHLVRRVRGVRRAAATLNLRAILRAANRTICVSETEHDELRRAVGARAARKAVVIRNGVRPAPPRSEDERRVTRAELGLSGSEPVAIWVGSLDDRKDPLTAIRAAERAGVALLVVGDGRLRIQVEQAATERVQVLGQRSDVGRLLAAADLFLLTSGREGLALSLLEAMAHGLAPIVTELPENLEAIGDAGLTVPAGDVEALADALGRLARDESGLALVGERARDRASEHFDAHTTATLTRGVYEKLLSSHLHAR